MTDEVLRLTRGTTLPDSSRVEVTAFVRHDKPFDYVLMGNYVVTIESANGETGSRMVLTDFQARELKSILASMHV